MNNILLRFWIATYLVKAAMSRFLNLRRSIVDGNLNCLPMNSSSTSRDSGTHGSSEPIAFYMASHAVLTFGVSAVATSSNIF